MNHRPWPRCPHCRGLALDLGSVRTRAWLSDPDLIVDVPTADGAARPVRRGAIVDPAGCARLLRRLLGDRLTGAARPLAIVTAPVLDGIAYRAAARTALAALRPHSVLTVPRARGIAVAAEAEPAGPLLVVDAGAQFTEVVLLCDGAVTDARRTAVGTADLESPAEPLAEAVASMVTAMLRQDRTPLTATALRRGALLAGGGALDPRFAHRVGALLHAPPRVVGAPHTAAVRGAAKLLRAAHLHPSAAGSAPPS
ncbi:hypothetical protein SRB5_19140 [Streptomyces sp. RB5]|uniref:Rod shape-determining protein MreB n=1 Tax=Streptomyces smaragdinus TaxID=2585196 RepID=A0A7K0CE95_9ACTN|nr:hypothetical protein [Streptomyces smaragdinus]MQY11795.1 hypothetical protein [Streptomyces smaragdinus]